MLPAAGVFHFKNPGLGHNGDLLCNLSYNDTKAAKFFDEKPAINGQADKRADIPVPADTTLPVAPGEQKSKET